MATAPPVPGAAQAPVPPPAAAATQPQATSWPLYDLFLDVPHPASSPKCPPYFVIGTPDNRSDLVLKEFGDANSISKIARFAFPDFDDQVPLPPKPPNPEIGGGAGLNRYDRYWYHHSGFQHHTFSLQLSDGIRVHGHVRCYLPFHLEARTRYDVGRRGIRAFVLLTRAKGGDALFSSILKTVEAISAQQGSTVPEFHPSAEPQRAFLHALHRNHSAISINYVSKPDDKKVPMAVSLQGAEFGNRPPFLPVDTCRFLMPVSLLQPAATDPNSSAAASLASPMMPLLRCLGVSHSLRLLSALLSERRVLLVSSSPTRLSICARSAISMLAQGLMHWQHLFIPVLPPHLLQYLAAPVPYLMGISSNLLPRVDTIPEIGELLIINLDTNNMEIRNIHPTQVLTKIPDLFREDVPQDPSSMAAAGPSAPGGVGNGGSGTSGSSGSGSNNLMSVSPAQGLAHELYDILKADKKTISGESDVQAATQAAVKKTKETVSKVWGKMKEKGNKFLAKQSGSYISESDQQDQVQDGAGDETEVLDESNHHNHQPPKTPSTTSDYIYAEACQNEAAEEEARIAFTIFFLCMFGDMKWYLTLSQPGQPPQLDRNKFIQFKRSRGEGEGTSIFPLLTNLVHSQMFEQFSQARVEEIRTRAPIGRDAPLFLVCSNHHRAQQIDFVLSDIRRVARQMAQTNPSRFLIQSNATARRLAMTLTSNKGYEGDYQQALAQLSEMAREASAVLSDVMAVVWMRIRDSKGMQWKHGLYALYIVKNLLLHGPLAAIIEVTDGLDKIRAMTKFTDTFRKESAQQIREAASQVYNLLVDRAKLFTMRRFCADRRRLIRNPPKGRLPRDNRLRVFSPFVKVHAALAPNGATPSKAPQVPPPAAAQQAPHPHHLQQQQQQQRYYQQQPTVAAIPPRGGPPGAPVDPVADLLGFAAGGPVANAVAEREQKANDVLGLMGNMSVSGGGQARPPQQQPTIVQMPPQAQQPTPAFAQPQPALPPQQQQQRPPQAAAAAAPPAFAQQPPPQAPMAYQQQQAAALARAGPAPIAAPGGTSHQYPGMAQAPPPQQQQQYPPQPRQANPFQPPPSQPQYQMPFPPQQQQQHPGYPPNPAAYQGQPVPPQQPAPNMFATAPQQQQQQQQQQQPPPRKNLSQFDPMADPFA